MLQIVRRVKLIVFVVALLLVNAMTWIVTDANLSKGIYPVDADSIGIPIGSVILLSMLNFPILIALGLFPDEKFFIWLKDRGPVQRLLVRIAASVAVFLFYVWLILFSVGGMIEWYVPHHYSIAASYFILFVALSIGLVADLIRITRVSFENPT